MADRQIELSLQDILTFPVTGFVWLLSEIRDMAERELVDDQTLAQHLMELQQAYESGEIDDAEYEAAWETYAARLDEAIARRQVPSDDGPGPGEEE